MTEQVFDEATRRQRLQILDSLLWDLEELNLGVFAFAPRAVVMQLRRAGIRAGSNETATALIERIFAAQEPLMLPAPDDAPRSHKDRPLTVSLRQQLAERIAS